MIMLTCTTSLKIRTMIHRIQMQEPASMILNPLKKSKKQTMKQTLMPRIMLTCMATVRIRTLIHQI